MTLTDESLALLAAFHFPSQDAVVDGLFVSEWLAAIEAAAVKRALTPERMARALHNPNLDIRCMAADAWAHPCEINHGDQAAAIIAALEAQP